MASFSVYTSVAANRRNIDDILYSIVMAFNKLRDDKQQHCESTKTHPKLKVTFHSNSFRGSFRTKISFDS